MAAPRYTSSLVASVPGIAQPSGADQALYGGLAEIAGDLGEIAFSEHRRKVLAAASEQGTLDGVRRAPDGTLTWVPREDDTEAAEAYNKAAQVGYLASMDNDMGARASELVREHQLDPAAFEAAWTGAREGWLGSVPDSLRPAVELRARQLGQASLNAVQDNRRRQDLRETKAAGELQIREAAEGIANLSRAGKGDAAEVDDFYATIADTTAGMVASGVWVQAQADAYTLAVQDEARMMTGLHAVEQVYDAKGEAAAQRYAEDLSQSLPDLSQEQRQGFLGDALHVVQRGEQVKRTAQSQLANSYVQQLYQTDNPSDWRRIVATARRTLTPGSGGLTAVEQLYHGKMEDGKAASGQRLMKTLLVSAYEGKLTRKGLDQIPNGALTTQQYMQLFNIVTRNEEGAAVDELVVAEVAMERARKEGKTFTDEEVDAIFDPSDRRSALFNARQIARNRTGSKGGEMADNQASIARAQLALQSDGEFPLPDNAQSLKDASALLKRWNLLAAEDGSPQLQGTEFLDVAPQMLFGIPENIPVLTEITRDLGVVAPEIQRGLNNALWNSKDPAVVNGAGAFIRALENSPDAADRLMAQQVRDKLTDRADQVYGLMKDQVPLEEARQKVADAQPGSLSSGKRVEKQQYEGITGERKIELDKKLEDVALVQHEGPWVQRAARSIGRILTPPNVTDPAGRDPIEAVTDPLLQPSMPSFPAGMLEDLYRLRSLKKPIDTPEASHEADMKAIAEVLSIWSVEPFQVMDPTQANPDQPFHWVKNGWRKWYAQDGKDPYVGMMEKAAQAYDRTIGHVEAERQYWEKSGADLAGEGRLWLKDTGERDDKGRPLFQAFYINDQLHPVLIPGSRISPVSEGSPEYNRRRAAERRVQDWVGKTPFSVFSGVLLDLELTFGSNWRDDQMRGVVKRRLAGIAEFGHDTWKSFLEVFMAPELPGVERPFNLAPEEEQVGREIARQVEAQ